MTEHEAWKVVLAEMEQDEECYGLCARITWNCKTDSNLAESLRLRLRKWRPEGVYDDGEYWWWVNEAGRLRRIEVVKEILEETKFMELPNED